MRLDFIVPDYFWRKAMPHRRKKKLDDPTVLSDFVTIAYAEDLDLAQQYKKLLNNCNIPAAIKDHPDPESPFPGVAVMVPEDYIDEAHSLIESEGSFPDFYDMIADKPQSLSEDEDTEGEY
jgi:hypothetical protein